MTLSARRVLKDCEYALELLEHASNNQIFRVYWFASVVLVRTVGDVLHKVDGIDVRFKRPVEEAYHRWKAHQKDNRIFWKFVKDQRDKLVHEYESDVYPSDKINLFVTREMRIAASGTAGNDQNPFELDENLYRPMFAGPWESEDCRDVLKQAIEWWKCELDKIDAAVASAQP
jgi:hypothetical protein